MLSMSAKTLPVTRELRLNVAKDVAADEDGVAGVEFEAGALPDALDVPKADALDEVVLHERAGVVAHGGNAADAAVAHDVSAEDMVP